MKTSKIFIAFSSVAVIVIAGFFLVQKTQSPIKIAPVSLIPKITQLPWKKYINTEYEYSIGYPEDVILSSNTDEGRIIIPIEKDYDITLSKGDSFTHIEISSLISLDNYQWFPKDMVQTYKKWMSGTLQSYANDIYKNQIDDKTSGLSKATVGELKKIVFAGKPTYSFTLTETFSFGGKNGGYVIPPSQTYNYIFTENNKGDKIMIHYPINDKISQEMIKTFSFTQ